MNDSDAEQPKIPDPVQWSRNMAQIVGAIFRIVAVGDEAVDELLAVDRAQRGVRLRRNAAKIGIGLVAALLQILLVLILAEVVILRDAGDVAVP